jgi:DNA polymerase-3 subunit delta'
LSHPDLHWFVPIPRPKAGDPDKQVEEAQETLAEVMAARRGQALYQPPDGLASHAIASIRLLQRRVALTPYMGKRKVVILGDAERLVVQESSPEAANALLKLLEEPPADTVVLTTAAEPYSLLPTIRSRLVPIRVGRLSDDVVRRFLETVPSPPLRGAELDRAVQLADGSIGRALAAGDAAAAADRAADRLLSAVRGGARAWAPVALAQPPWSARGDFSAMLDALARRIRASAVAGEARRSGGSWIRALRRVEGIREEAQGNANPQLALAVLAAELEQAL